MSSRHALPHNLRRLRPSQSRRLFEVAHRKPAKRPIQAATTIA